jgi:hypothetical protein
VHDLITEILWSFVKYLYCLLKAFTVTLYQAPNKAFFAVQLLHMSKVWWFNALGGRYLSLHLNVFRRVAVIRFVGWMAVGLDCSFTLYQVVAHNARQRIRRHARCFGGM